MVRTRPERDTFGKTHGRWPRSKQLSHDLALRAMFITCGNSTDNYHSLKKLFMFLYGCTDNLLNVLSYSKNLQTYLL